MESKLYNIYSQSRSPYIIIPSFELVKYNYTTLKLKYNKFWTISPQSLFIIIKNFRLPSATYLPNK